MIILSHRGYWKKISEKNTEIAFRNSFKLGLGIETDIRDYKDNLVISHNIPSGNEMTFRNFLNIYKEYSKELPLALNIKADGLQKILKKDLSDYQIKNYFVFDMSVPDGIIYLKNNISSFTRQSEYEKECSFYKQATGVWVDCFHDNWVTEEIIIQHIKHNKQVCFVSPELHGRECNSFWQKLSSWSIVTNDNLMLCTDLPKEAKRYFE
jgi:hypothetical protein